MELYYMHVCIILSIICMVTYRPCWCMMASLLWLWWEAGCSDDEISRRPACVADWLLGCVLCLCQQVSCHQCSVRLLSDQRTLDWRITPVRMDWWRWRTGGHHHCPSGWTAFESIVITLMTVLCFCFVWGTTFFFIFYVVLLYRNTL